MNMSVRVSNKKPVVASTLCRHQDLLHDLGGSQERVTGVDEGREKNDFINQINAFHIFLAASAL